MRMRGTTWPVTGGCKIITYLESQIPSFLLIMYIFQRATMTIKGRLLSSIAVVKRFQTENNLTLPKWQAPFPLEFRNHLMMEN